MANPMPTQPDQPKQSKPSLILLLCCFVPFNFLATYTIAWFGCRDDVNMQHRINWPMEARIGGIGLKLKYYKAEKGQYPPDLMHLFANIMPDDVIPESEIEALQLKVHQETLLTPMMNLHYRRMGDSYELSHYGLDEKEGGVGLYADIIYRPIQYEGSGTPIPASTTRPTLKQFIFEMAGSGAIFKAALCVNVIFITALLLHLSRKSARFNLWHALLYMFILIPFAIFIALSLASTHVSLANSTH